MTNVKKKKNYVSTASTERKFIEQDEDELTFVINDIFNNAHQLCNKGSLNTIEKRLLLPAPVINTTGDTPFMVLDNVNIPITMKESLWELTISIVSPQSRSAFLNRGDPHQLSIKTLRSFNIHPLNFKGQVPSKGELADLTGLFLQVIHVRTGHYSSLIFSRFLQRFNINIPATFIKALTKNCKVCASKVTLHKPKRKQKVRAKHQQPQIEEVSSGEDDFSSSSSEDNVLNTHSFNHILFQDCISLPTSLK